MFPDSTEEQLNNYKNAVLMNLAITGALFILIITVIKRRLKKKNKHIKKLQSCNKT